MVIDGEKQHEGLTITKSCDFEEVVKKLQSVPLRGAPDIYKPYGRAEITLEEVPIDQLCPCAKYVLRENLVRVGDLRETFLAQGIDILNLPRDKALIEYDWQGNSGCIISPPIVEVSKEDGGINVITDGLHRVVVARELGLAELTVVKLRGSSTPLPALPVSWDKVNLVTAVPSVSEKRDYRFGTMSQLQRWMASNYPKYITGYNFPEIDLLKEEGYMDSHLENSEGMSDISHAAVIMNHNGGILMVQRRGKGENLWTFPSGHEESIDYSESSVWAKYPAATMRRELFEETGLVALRWRKILRIPGDKRNKSGVIWEVQVTDEEGERVGEYKKRYVPIDLRDYCDVFNARGGNLEVARLAVLSSNEIMDLDDQGLIYKPHYTMLGEESVLWERYKSGSLDNVHFSLDKEDIMEWNSQEGVSPKVPYGYYFRRDFSLLRT